MLRSLQTTVSCIALAFAAPYAAIAAEITTNTTAPVAVHAESTAQVKDSSKLEQQKQNQTAEKRKQITAEAIAAINETQNALKALDDGKKEEAISALERATGRLELILARDPKLALAPTNVSATTIELIADTEKVKAVRLEAEKLLEDGKVQAARHLLEGLAMATNATSRISTRSSTISKIKPAMENREAAFSHK